MADPNSIAKVRRFVDSYSTKGPYTLYPDDEVVANVVRGLADNLEAHGKMYCPCAPVEESKERGHDMVCPCTPHPSDIARQGYCDCALFASRDFVAAERLRRSIARSDASSEVQGTTANEPRRAQ